MNIDKIHAQLRPRPAWEAVDFGLNMFRKWFLVMLTPLLQIMLPTYVLLAGICYVFLPDSPFNHFVYLIILWWLSPFFERIALIVLSRELFGESLSAKQIRKQFWQYAKQKWFWYLLVQKLNPTRTFSQPVVLLEQLKGQALSNRLKTLKWSESSALTLTHFIFFFLQWITIASLIPLLVYIIPGVDQAFEIQLEHSMGYLWYEQAPWYLILIRDVSFISIFVLFNSLSGSIGFALYINRRTHLEAWDIEQALKNLANKFGCLLMVPLLFTAMTISPMAQSEEHPAKTDINLVMEDEVFHKLSKEEDIDWEQVDKNILGGFLEWLFDVDWSEDDEKEDKEEPVEFDKDWGLPISGLLQILAIGFLVAFVGWVIYRYRNNIADFLQIERSERIKKPLDEIMGMAINKESLPDDVAQTAIKLWENGQFRESLALLYRASLSTLHLDHYVEFEFGDTERDCLARCEHINNQNLSSSFKQLTKLWVDFAYGHKDINNDDFYHLVSSWRNQFLAPKYKEEQ